MADRGGRGASYAAETFTSRPRALVFKADVEAAGGQWPQGWVKGQGYVVATEAPRATVEEVARGYLASLRKPVARHDHRLQRAAQRTELRAASE